MSDEMIDWTDFDEIAAASEPQPSLCEKILDAIAEWMAAHSEPPLLDLMNWREDLGAGIG